MAAYTTRLKQKSPQGVGSAAHTGRIAVCHIASGDLWAGAEAQTASLLRWLAQRDELSLSVILLNEGRLAEKARESGIDVKVIPEAGKGFLQIFREATNYLRGRGIHLLHSHRYKENLLAALLAWRCQIPFVVRSQHGLPEPFGGLRHCKQSLVRVVDGLVARYATDRVISVSSELRGHLTRYIDPRKVVVVQNGLDIDQVRSNLSCEEAKEKLGIPGDYRVIGTAGRLEPIKRLDYFLQAAKLVSGRIGDARFVIAGEGRERPRLEELAHTLSLEKQVLFLGHRSDIYDVLRALDVFVLCSDHEGLPMVLLEALYLGVPVVARSVGGITDVVQDGVNGVLIESGETPALAAACLDLLLDDDRKKRLATAAIASVSEKFTAQRNAAEVAGLYRSLCGIK